MIANSARTARNSTSTGRLDSTWPSASAPTSAWAQRWPAWKAESHWKRSSNASRSGRSTWPTPDSARHRRSEGGKRCRPGQRETAMTGRVEGKVAFISGAARGQGRSHAVRLAQEGADIIAVDICGPIENLAYPPSTPADLAETVDAVKNLGRRIVAEQVDVRDYGALKAAVEGGVEQLGRLDIIVAN